MQQTQSFHLNQFSFRKKPRLSIHQIGLLQDHFYASKQIKNKLLQKRKITEIDLRAVLLSKQQPQIYKPKQFHQQMQLTQNLYGKQLIGRSFSIPTLFQFQSLQMQQSKKALRQRKQKIQKVKNKVNQKVKFEDTLLPILKNYLLQLNEEKNEEHEERNKSKEEKQQEKQNCKKKSFKLDINSQKTNNIQSGEIGLKKMKSQTLIHLKRKFRLHKALKLSNGEKKNQEVNQTLHKQQNPQQSQITLKGKTKIFIKSLKLDQIQNHQEMLPKKNFILKLVERRENDKSLKLSSRKKESFPSINLNEKDEKMMSPIKIISTDKNLVSKKVVSVQPNQLFLKKLQVSPKNEQRQLKYQKYILLKSSRSIKNENGKLSNKDRILGWEFQRDVQEDELQLDGYSTNLPV